MSTLSLSSRLSPKSRSRSAGPRGREESSDRTHTRSPLPSTPRMPSLSSIHPEGFLRPSRDKPDTIRTDSFSTASSSTSRSSFLDRMKTPSSRTSFEDNQPEPPRRGGGGWAASRGKRAAQVASEHFDEEEHSPGPLLTSNVPIMILIFRDRHFSVNCGARC